MQRPAPKPGEQTELAGRAHKAGESAPALAAYRAPLLASAAMEVRLTDGEYRRIAALAHANAGIVLGPNKQLMVQGRLQPRLRAHGLKTYGEYLSLLQQADSKELEQFVNALTTNLTAFFREAHHFPILAKHTTGLRLTHSHRMVWSSACSTGEEAYSIAMTLVETYGSFNPPVKVLATDIDTSVLHKAAQGIYPLAKLRELSPQRIKRFFVLNQEAGTATVRPELRALIVFRPVNLLDAAWSIRPPIDAIFCRNVMIYFDRPTQAQILGKFAPLMHPEGLLFVGHSENYTRHGDLFVAHGNTIYELSARGKELAQRAKERWRPPPAASALGAAHAASPAFGARPKP